MKLLVYTLLLLFLTLPVYALEDSMSEGETKTYTLGGYEYEITAAYISGDNHDAVFRVNNLTMNPIVEGEVVTLSLEGVVVDVEALEVTGEHITIQFGDITTPSLGEGDEFEVVYNGVAYDIKVIFISSENEARFVVNGKTTSDLNEGEDETFGDLTLRLMDLLLNERSNVAAFELSHEDEESETEYPVHVVVGETAPTSDVIASVDLIRNMYETDSIPVGVAVIDVNAHDMVLDDPNLLHKRVFILLSGDRALVSVGQHIRANAFALLSNGIDYLEDEEYDIVQVQGSDVRAEYLLAENIGDLFDEKQEESEVEEEDETELEEEQEEEQEGPEEEPEEEQEEEPEEQEENPPSVEEPVVDEPVPEPVCNGCLVDGACVPVGYRLAGEPDMYCDPTGLLEQKESAASCQNNHECLTNVCVDGECVESGFIQKVFAWFKRIFS